jgi:hypothetical protein
MAKGERPQERAQRGRCPDPGEQPVHTAMSQKIHVIDAVRPGDHPCDKRRDLQVRVHATFGLQRQGVDDQVAQPSPVCQCHRRGQPGARDQVSVVEDRGDGWETMRNSHSANALLCG